MIKIKMINDGGDFELTQLKTVIDRDLIIPSFQRAYAWDENNIEDLFNTISQKFLENSDNKTLLQDNKNTHPTFFGSVIFAKYKDRKYQTKYQIIDGQQRVTTFLFILRVIQDKIREEKPKIKERLYTLDRQIRDAFNKKDYAKHEELSNKRTKENKEMDRYENLIKRIDALLKKANIEREGITTAEDKLENEYLHYIMKQLDSNSICKTLKDFKKNKISILNHIDNLTLNFTSSSLYQKYNQFVEFILKEVKFCILCIEGEDATEYAINVFNTLNSTGEPLTGFEVMKSTLIQIAKSSSEERLAQNVEKKLFDIENKIKAYKATRKERNIQKGNLLFYLATHRMNKDHYKKKISDKKFKEQFDYIKHILISEGSQKNKSQQINKTLDIINDLEKLNNFVVSNWFPKNKERDYTKKFESNPEYVLALKGFDFLIDIGHDRTIPVIYKYSESFLKENFDKQDYKKIIEYCVSFSCLWRAIHDGGTKGIDREYLEIVKCSEHCTIEEIRDIILKHLKNKISSKDFFLKNFSQSEVGKNKKLTQFLLAFLTLKDFSSYKSSDWKLHFRTTNNSVTKNHIGNIVLVKKDFKAKNLTAYLQNHSSLYNDIMHDYVDENTKSITEEFSQLIWNKLAIKALGYK